MKCNSWKKKDSYFLHKGYVFLWFLNWFPQGSAHHTATTLLVVLWAFHPPVDPPPGENSYHQKPRWGRASWLDRRRLDESRSLQGKDNGRKFFLLGGWCCQSAVVYAAEWQYYWMMFPSKLLSTCYKMGSEHLWLPRRAVARNALERIG